MVAVQRWRRLAAVVADTWKGFSNLAGLSSTVTFVTVTHAILEPQPSKANPSATVVCRYKKRVSVKGRARTRACRNRRGLKGDAWSCICAHVCAVPRTYNLWGPSRCVPRKAGASRSAVRAQFTQGVKSATLLALLVAIALTVFTSG